MEGGYFDHCNGVTPGRYYMLAPNVNPPPIEVQLSSYGMIDLPFAELDYEAWLVLIDATTDLEFIGIYEKPLDCISNLISWAEETNKLPGTYGLEKAFIGKLPPIALLRSELFSSNSIGLFIDDGEDIRRVDPSDFSDDKVHINLPIKTQGRIWAEPISRMREFAGLDTLGELSFFLLPECRITWPDRLYRFGEQPYVTFHVEDDDIHLEIEEAEPIDNNKQNWRVMPEVRFIQGYLKSSTCEVPLARRVFRADIRKRSELHTPLLVSSDFETPINLIVSGIPKTKAVVALTDGEETRLIGELGIFNEAGEISFSSFALRDALARYSAPVGQFAVMDGSIMVRTETLFIHWDAICEWIDNPSSSTDARWWSLLPFPIARLFTIILQIRKEPLVNVGIPEDTESIPKNLIHMFETIRRMCFIFDGSKFPDRSDATLSQVITELLGENQQMAAFISWFVRAKKIFDAENVTEENDAEALLAEYSGLSWQPPFQRWKGMIESIVDYLKTDMEALPLVDEWRKDVENSYTESYKSRIASRAGGRELTHAWVMYRAGSLLAAINKVKILLDGGVSSPISDLAAILLRLCWFRLCYFKSQPEIGFISSNKKLKGSYEELIKIIDFADWTDNHPVPETENLRNLADVLPITTQDSCIFKMFTEAKNDRLVDNEKDWLACYCSLLLARTLNMQKEAKGIALTLQGIVKTVPASPDLTLLDKLMEKYL